MSARTFTLEDKTRLLAVVSAGGSLVEAAKVLGWNVSVLSHSVCADREFRAAVATARREGAKMKAAQPKPPPKPKPTPAMEAERPRRADVDTRPRVGGPLLDAMLARAHAAAKTVFESKTPGKGRPRYPLPANWAEARKLIHGIADSSQRAGCILALLDEIAGRASDEDALAWNRTG